MQMQTLRLLRKEYKMTDKKKNIDFEAATKRIEEIVSKLEDTNLKLDESLALYEEGVALVALCRGKLEEAEQKISCLLPDENGEIVEKPFLAEEL